MTKRLLPIIIAMGLLSGCGSGKTTDESSETATVHTVAEILSEVQELDPDLDGSAFKGDEAFDSNCAKLYTVEAEMLLDGGILYNQSGASASEVSILSVDNGADGLELLNDRLNDRTAAYEGYAPDEMPKLEGARVYSNGGYDILIISDKAEEIEELINKKIG